MRYFDEAVLTKKKTKDMRHPKDEFNLQITIFIMIAFLMFACMKVLE